MYWSTIPKDKRDELQAAAAAAGTTVQINEDGTALVQTAATGVLLLLLYILTSVLYNFSVLADTVMLCLMTVQYHVCCFKGRKVYICMFLHI